MKLSEFNLIRDMDAPKLMGVAQDLGLSAKEIGDCPTNDALRLKIIGKTLEQEQEVRDQLPGGKV